MSKLIEALLNTDKAKLTERVTKTIEIKRLSELTGTEFEIKVQAISNREFKDINSRTSKFKKKEVTTDFGLSSELIVLAGLVEPNLKDKRVLDYFGCYSANEVIDKLFNAGEVTKISEIILEISGITEDEEDEIEEINDIKKQ